MTIQELQFELMERASFNGFDGEKVVASLQNHSNLWRGVVMDRAYYGEANEHGWVSGGVNLIKLRDIKDNYWNVDTLFILPTQGKETELELLAQEWGADEVDWVGGEEACRMLGSYSPEGRSNSKAILRVWWD